MFPTFAWAAVSGGKQPLLVHAPNVFFHAMRHTFGPFPLTLTTAEVPVLRALATGSLDERAYADLIDALQQHGMLTVTA
jgi:hypothetical protein